MMVDIIVTAQLNTSWSDNVIGLWPTQHKLLVEVEDEDKVED